MITLKNLKIENFLSHHNTELSFNEELQLLISGKSGSGKSSIVEGILWCLYGKGRVDNRNIIRKGAKNAFVALELLDNGVCYQIERKTSEKGKQTLNMAVLEDDNTVDVVKVEGLREKQDWIEKTLLKSSYTLFINSILYLQDNVDTFVKQSAGKRKELLLEIASIEDYEMYYNRAKEELRLTEETRTRTETLIVEKERIVDDNVGIFATLPELEKKEYEINTLIQSTQKQLDSILIKSEKKKDFLRDVSTIENLISNINKHINEYILEIKEYEISLSNLQNVNVTLINDGVKQLEEKRAQLVVIEKKEKEDIEHNDKIRYLAAQKPSEYDYAGDIASLNKQLIELMTSKENYCPVIKNNCPTLQKRSESQRIYIESQLEEKKEKYKVQTKAIETYVERLIILGEPREINNDTIWLRSEIKGLEHWEKEKIENVYREEKIKDLTIKTHDLKIKLKECEDGMKVETNKLETLNKILLEYTEDYLIAEKGFKNSLFQLQSNSMSIMQELTLARHAMNVLFEAKKDLVGLKSSFGDTLHRIEVLGFIKEAFGSKGIKTLVIDHIVPLLETKINEILGQLSEFRIRLDTQRQGADGESLVEGLYINIVNDIGEEHDYDAYSGGERVKITVAISEALASLQKCSFRILDEAITALDEESTESFIDVLNQLKSRFKQIFCISHIRQVKDTFDNVLEVTKENGISRVV